MKNMRSAAANLGFSEPYSLQMTLDSYEVKELTPGECVRMLAEGRPQEETVNDSEFEPDSECILPAANM